MMFNSNCSIILHVYQCSMLSIFLLFNVHFQGCTPLHTASSRGNDNTVRYLLLVGADKDIKNKEVPTYMVFLLIYF